MICFHSCEIKAHHLRRQNRNVTEKSYTVSLEDHIHQQSSKSGYGRKPSPPLKLLASFTPNPHNQIMEGGIKRKAYKKSKAYFLPVFLHLFIIQELQETTQKLSNEYTQIVAVSIEIAPGSSYSIATASNLSGMWQGLLTNSNPRGSPSPGVSENPAILCCRTPPTLESSLARN